VVAGQRARFTGDVAKADRNTWQQAAAGHVGGEGYDGGHLIASLFGGACERINLVPQLSSVNRGEFREMERQWAQAVLDQKTVRVEVLPVYVEGSTVPQSIVARWSINGTWSEKTFPNLKNGG
jgi:filamentous hemagglutinin